jgi:hypothetical protein
VRSARSSGTRPSSRSPRASRPGNAVAAALAAAYFLAVIVTTVLERSGSVEVSALQSSADLIAGGELWRLLASGLVVEGAAVPQILLTAIAAIAFVRLEGAVLWWAAVLVGHVGSALLAYAIIGVASALGSGGAEAAADDPDFGISCVLGATLGALFASGLRRDDRTLVGVAALGFFALLPFSLDWYGPEHPLSFVLGAAVVLGATRAS